VVRRRESREESRPLSPLGSESLDDPNAPPALVRRMLADIAVCNRWLGGAHAMRSALAQLLDRSDRGRTLTLFDIGTGAADLPRDARRWAARRGVSIVPFALERIPAAAQLARDAGVPTLLGCGSALPLRPRSIDIVLLSQVVHHLDADTVVRLLAASSAIARRGVIIADLHRSWFAIPAFRFAGTVLRLHPLTIADGVTSVRRGYTTAELYGLCARAGAANVTVTRTLGSRVIAWWRTASRESGVGTTSRESGVEKT
jgi:SAM-dependent methyltransferase